MLFSFAQILETKEKRNKEAKISDKNASPWSTATIKIAKEMSIAGIDTKREEREREWDCFIFFCLGFPVLQRLREYHQLHYLLLKKNNEQKMKGEDDEKEQNERFLLYL